MRTASAGMAAMSTSAPKVCVSTPRSSSPSRTNSSAAVFPDPAGPMTCARVGLDDVRIRSI
jgi:hypothetical protein